MARLELGVSPEGLDREGHGWDEQAAYRELVQNARDEEVLNSHPMSVVYWPGSQTLLVRNEGAKMDRATLLMGVSRGKRGDDRAIGSFGSGYKMAMLVLCKMGRKVTVQNGDEAWTASIETSPQFGAEVLTVQTRARQSKDDDLVFSVSGVTPAAFQELLSRALFLGVSESTASRIVAEMCDEGFGKHVLVKEWNHCDRVLLDPKHRGRIYVKGLFVFSLPKSEREAKYGYDFGALQLDESRKMADPWDFKYRLGQLQAKVAERTPEARKEFVQMLKEGGEEVGHVSEYGSEKLAKAILEDQYAEHGADTMLVRDENDAQRVRSLGVKAVVLPDKLFTLVRRSLPSVDDAVAKLRSEVVAEVAPASLDRKSRAAWSQLEAAYGGVTKASWPLPFWPPLKLVQFRSDSTFVRAESGCISVGVQALNRNGSWETLAEVFREIAGQLAKHDSEKWGNVDGASLMAQTMLGLVGLTEDSEEPVVEHDDESVTLVEGDRMTGEGEDGAEVP